MLSGCKVVGNRNASLTSGKSEAVLSVCAAHQPLPRSHEECDCILVMHLGKTRRIVFRILTHVREAAEPQAAVTRQRELFMLWDGPVPPKLRSDSLCAFPVAVPVDTVSFATLLGAESAVPCCLCRVESCSMKLAGQRSSPGAGHGLSALGSCSPSLLSVLAEPFQDTDDLGEQSLRESPPAVIPASQHELEQLLLRSLLAHVSWSICCS